MSIHIIMLSRTGLWRIDLPVIVEQLACVTSNTKIIISVRDPQVTAHIMQRTRMIILLQDIVESGSEVSVTVSELPLDVRYSCVVLFVQVYSLLELV